MAEWLQRLRHVVRDLWLGVSGTYAYEQYRSHIARAHPGVAPLTRAEFCRRDLVERWDGVRRCC